MLLLSDRSVGHTLRPIHWSYPQAYALYAMVLLSGRSIGPTLRPIYPLVLPSGQSIGPLSICLTLILIHWSYSQADLNWPGRGGGDFPRLEIIIFFFKLNIIILTSKVDASGCEHTKDEYGDADADTPPSGGSSPRPYAAAAADRLFSIQGRVGRRR